MTHPFPGDSVKTVIHLKGKNIRSLPVVLAVLACSAFADDVVLPDGKGREQVENACTVCHTAERITHQAMNTDQWRSEVRTMVENGASLNPDEWEPVVAYLVRNFGPKVKINTAPAKEISEALQLTQSEAEAIVAWRKENGPFRQFKDLGKIPTLDPKKIAAKESRIEF